MIKGKRIEINTSNWETATERAVGFIDIMGFKDLVARKSQDEIYKMMKQIRESAFSAVMAFGVDEPDEGKSYESNIFITTYSDSIIVYSKDNSPENIQNFIAAVSSLTEDLFTHHIPHKGAIASGTMTLDFKNSIFFGQPLIDAYLLHDELSFYGVVIHATAHKLFEKHKEEGLYEYNCPFKSGAANHLTILPNLFFVKPIEDEHYNNFCDHIKNFRIMTSGGLRAYIDKTLQYFDNAKKALSRVD